MKMKDVNDPRSDIGNINVRVIPLRRMVTTIVLNQISS